MGYPTVTEFDKKFIERTRQNLTKDLPNNYTNLVNSLLGLLILPKQWQDQGKRNVKFFATKVRDHKELDFLRGEDYVQDELSPEPYKIPKLVSKHQSYDDITLDTMIEKLRNSLAHQSIRATNEGENWRGIIFRNYKSDAKAGDWNENYEFQLYLTMSEVKTFALFITDQYLAEGF